MKPFTVKVTDTVTYKRVFAVTVNAATRAAAEEMALNEARTGDIMKHPVLEDDQIDNTPWEIEP